MRKLWKNKRSALAEGRGEVAERKLGLSFLVMFVSLLFSFAGVDSGFLLKQEAMCSPVFPYGSLASGLFSPAESKAS